MSYHNTTNSQGQELMDYQLKAETQKEAIIELFDKHEKLSPSQAWRKYMLGCGKSNVPITSIRRCISDLTREGYLKQTTEKMFGSYGRQEYKWTKA